MKSLFITLVLCLFIQNYSYAQFDIDGNYIYSNELTFYLHLKDPEKKSYCATVDINAQIMLLESSNNLCGSKKIDYEVLIERDYSYTLIPATNKLLSKQSFTDPVFALKLATQIAGLSAQAVTGNLKIEKAK